MEEKVKRKTAKDDICTRNSVSSQGMIESTVMIRDAPILDTKYLVSVTILGLSTLLH